MLRDRFLSMSYVKFAFAFMTVTTFGHAQSTDFDAFLRAGADDASKLIEYYMEPLVVGFSYGMSNSWYNTAKTHKTLGFDLTITANLTSVPSSKEYFRFAPSEYSNVISTGETDEIPTIMGSDEDRGAQLTFSYFDEHTGETINGSFSPTGLGIGEEYGYNAVPSPMVQMGIGTFKNTDVIIRYTPEIRYGDFKSSVFGMGIKHDIKQWIPGMKRVPIDMAILAGFSGFDNSMDMSDLDLDGENQEAVFNINNWTLQGIASKKISVLTIYAAFGYSSVSSNLKLNGTYVIEDEINPLLTFSVQDPINLKYTENSFRATGGIRFKFGPVTLHGDYTWQAYHIVSAGLGFSFR
ncbi:MAG: hypothetical protein MI975_01710 [Cytophagales bacterium]|nr:hypothetical protein [Cytophagales bacterium]